jgi:hypothetical protein
MAVTLQNNIKNFTDGELTKYALFLGGANVTQDALSHYDPLKGGFGRLFMIRQPVWVKQYFSDGKDGENKMNVFKHILEYANTSINGLQSITVDSQQMTGGYAQRNINIPTSVTDGMDNFSVTVYEFSGSPVREVLHTWINGSIDIQSGLTTYYSNRSDGGNPLSSLKRSQANQTAEFIYVMTDHTGEPIEYACMLANCFPTAIDEDPFNYTAGQHELIQTTINFNCVKYESLQINEVAKALITRYKILTNSLNFHSGFNVSDLSSAGTKYDITDGKLKEDPNPAPYDNKPDDAYNNTTDNVYFTANTLPTNS